MRAAIAAINGGLGPMWLRRDWLPETREPVGWLEDLRRDHHQLLTEYRRASGEEAALRQRFADEDETQRTELLAAAREKRDAADVPVTVEARRSAELQVAGEEVDEALTIVCVFVERTVSVILDQRLSELHGIILAARGQIYNNAAMREEQELSRFLNVHLSPRENVLDEVQRCRPGVVVGDGLART